jgi:hypothetical protein
MQAVQTLRQYLVWQCRAFFARVRRLVALFWEPPVGGLQYIFSILFLLRSLFAPFERMHENVLSDPNEIFENIMSNIILRLVGAVLRLAISGIGLILLAITLLLEVAAFILWPLLPFVAVGALCFAVGAFF